MLARMTKYTENLRKLFSRRYIRWWTVIVASVFVYLVWPVRWPLMEEDYSRIILDRKERLMRVYLKSNEQYCFPPNAQTQAPEKLVKATLLFEDKYFYSHPGVNLWALIRAAYLNIREGRVVSGGSTISMQVARMRKGRKRTLPAKIMEIGEALRIEIRLSKDEILHTYLNHAPYGGNVKGYQAASYRFLGKPPGELSWAEAALLAVLPNSPGSVTPYSNEEALLKKRNKLLERLFVKGEMDSLTLELAYNEPMPKGVWPFPFYAPQFTRFANEKAHYETDIIRSSIDLDIQERIRYLAQRHMRQMQAFGISNCAVLIAETRTGKVRAYLGSSDYYDTMAQGMVDGVIAERSSGSLLKPFLYALSAQEGVLLPETQLMDIPTYYGNFSPHNASEQFDGVVTARDALIRSLNVPAVRVLYTYGQYSFYNFLKEAGLSTLFRPADDYGLSLIIGGSEVTLWDMLVLYRGLGNYGMFGELTIEESEVSVPKVPLLDSASVMLILECMKDLKRPGVEYYWERYNTQRPVAWKTGTSYGHKDAWALAVTPDWTIGVWAGNFDGSGNKNLSGAQRAGPLLFDIINSLPQLSDDSWFGVPEKLIEDYNLCAVTGYTAGDACPESIRGQRPVRAAPLKICPYHLNIRVDKTESIEVCSYCWQPGHKEKSVLYYPPGVLQHIRNKGNIIERLPPHSPGCLKKGGHLALEVLYPRPGMRIQLTRDFDGKLQPLILQAAHTHPEQRLFWFVDGIVLGSTTGKHQVETLLPERIHTLTILDRYGNRTDCRFETFIRE